MCCLIRKNEGIKRQCSGQKGLSGKILVEDGPSRARMMPSPRWVEVFYRWTRTYLENKRKDIG